jgi:hypothetical protein
MSMHIPSLTTCDISYRQYLSFWNSEILVLALYRNPFRAVECRDATHPGEIASAFMVSCPSLRRISFRTGRDSDLTHFVKYPSGEVHMESISTIDESWQWHT